MAENRRLFEQFPPVTTKEWLDKIIADLKGADFNKKLVWKTGEGFEVMPFYRSEDTADIRHIATAPGQFPYVRGGSGNGNRWLVRQNIEVDNYSAANAKALDILMKGVDSIGFAITDPETITEANIASLLSGIHPDAIELNFLSEGKAKEILAAFRNYLLSAGIPLSHVKGAIETDPLGRLMLNGKLCVSLDEGFDYLAGMTALSSDLPLFRTIQVNASHFGNAGTDIVSELAFGLSMGNEYMSVLTDRGIDPAMAASKIRFSFGIGSNYFFEIARLRAARLLWSVITDGYNPAAKESCRMEIHCVTSEWNKTLYDPYVNMLRTQTEAMSATLGGTDSLTVAPYDSLFRKPDQFSERIARNQQLLLKEEAYFDKVADPAGGSYYIEKLTSLIAESAWNLFVETEENGGFIASLKSGSIQRHIRESAIKRQNDVASRKLILLGTNQYPDQKETKEAGINMSTERGDDADLLVEHVRLLRGAEEIEKLRLAADQAERRPVVFMLTIGNLAMRRARAQFSCSFFACGGYNVIDNHGFNTPEEGVEEALKSGAAVIVICSSDEEYELLAPVVLKKISGRAITVVAGNPECMDKLKEAGIEHFISLRSNIVGTLKEFHRMTGITIRLKEN